MKKILLLFILFNFALTAFATDIDKEYGFLKLSSKQQKKIEQIELEYGKKIVETNSMILLKNMQIAQKRKSSDVALLQKEIKTLEYSLDELKKDKRKKILSCLNFFQKIKYKKQYRSD